MCCMLCIHRHISIHVYIYMLRAPPVNYLRASGVDLRAFIPLHPSTYLFNRQCCHCYNSCDHRHQYRHIHSRTNTHTHYIGKQTGNQADKQAGSLRGRQPRCNIYNQIANISLWSSLYLRRCTNSCNLPPTNCLLSQMLEKNPSGEATTLRVRTTFVCQYSPMQH